MKIVILCPDYPPDQSGLADHTSALAAHLADRGDVTVITSRRHQVDDSPSSIRICRLIPRWDLSGFRIAGRLLRQLDPDWLIVQYVPHMYGRAGINLGLPFFLWWWHLRGGAILIMVHELYIPWSVIPKRCLAALLQRKMLFMILTAARRVAVSTEVWEEKLKRIMFFRRSCIHHVPIPSNIPVVPWSDSEQSATRERLGISFDTLVLGFFGTLHDSKLTRYVVESLRVLQAEGRNVHLLCIGPTRLELTSSMPALHDEDCRWITCTGYLKASEVSRFLSVIDIFLLPLIDGVSSRRGSLMAALSHGVPVVGTSGEGTDRLLRDSDALRLSPVEDIQAFVESVTTLAGQKPIRRRIGAAGRMLYQDHFSWPHVIHALWSVMEADEDHR